MDTVGENGPTVPADQAFDIGRGLTNGINAVRRNFWVFLVGGLVKACTEGGGGGGGNGFDESDIDTIERLIDEADRGAQNGMVPGLPWVGEGLPDLDPGMLLGLGALYIGVLMAVVLGVVIVVTALQAWFLPGWIRLHAEIARTGEGKFGTLFGTFDVFLPSLGWVLLSGLLGLVMVLVAVLPLVGLFFVDGSGLLLVGAFSGLWLLVAFAGAVYLRLCLAFVHHAIALEGLGVMAAIDRSFQLTAGARGWLFVYMLATSVVTWIGGVAGLLLCLIGALVTIPLRLGVRDYGFTEGFLRFTRPPDEVAGYACNTWE